MLKFTQCFGEGMGPAFCSVEWCLGNPGEDSLGRGWAPGKLEAEEITGWPLERGWSDLGWLGELKLRLHLYKLGGGPTLAVSLRARGPHGALAPCLARHVFRETKFCYTRLRESGCVASGISTSSVYDF